MYDVAALSGVTLLIVLFLLCVAVLWFILPFALFGTKPILRSILRETEKTNALLERITAGTSVQSRAPPP